MNDKRVNSCGHFFFQFNFKAANIISYDPLKTSSHFGKAREWPTGKQAPGIIPESSQIGIIALIT